MGGVKHIPEVIVWCEPVAGFATYMNGDIHGVNPDVYRPIGGAWQKRSTRLWICSSREPTIEMLLGWE